MANFNSGTGITFPSPQPLQYGAPVVGFTQGFTPNSTSNTNNLMFPTPPQATPPSLSSLNGVSGSSRGGILCSASDSCPASSHCMATSWQNAPNQMVQWAPSTVASPEMTMFNTAAANFSSNISPASPVPSTSGLQQNAFANKSKRKSHVADLPARSSVSSEEEPQNKIHVNEERMAARMQELHLDNNLDWHPDLEHQQQQQRQQQRNAEAWYSRSRNSPGPSNNNNGGHSVLLTSCSTSSSEDYDSEDSSPAGSVRSNSPQRRQRSKSCPKIDFSPELELTLKTRRLLPIIYIRLLLLCWSFM